jgi:3-oxoacyl-[acyl-carrier-protein] synthase II
MTGHLLGAAGAIESIICTLAIKNNLVPPTINTTILDTDAPQHLHILLGEAKNMQVNYALNNTFGFGGHTASSIFKKFNPPL